MMKDGGSFVWHSKSLPELEAYVNGPKPAAKKMKAPAKPEPVEFKRDAKIVQLSLDHAIDGKAEDYLPDGEYGENSIANLATAKRELRFSVSVDAIPFENGAQSLWSMHLSSGKMLSWASKSLPELTELAAVPVKKAKAPKAS